MALPSQTRNDADIGLKLDIIAAGSMGPCKSQHRENLVKPQSEAAFWDCIQNYSTGILQRWGSREKNGFTYYFERGSATSQWDRPAQLQKTIQDGLAAARQGEGYSADKPWETCELLSIAHLMCLQKRTARCDSIQQDYFQCMRMRRPRSAM